MRNASEHARKRFFWPAYALFTALLLFGASACFNIGPITPPAMPDDGDGGEPVIGILNFLTNIEFSDDVVLTVLYSVPDDAVGGEGFVQLLTAPADAGGAPLGVEEIIATDLPAGQNQAFSLDTGPLRPGFYQIGLRAGGVTYLSLGTIEIQGSPSPLFIDPAEDVTITQGESFTIRADVGDPQGVANWRLFFQGADTEQLEEGQLPGGQLLGQRIVEGAGNSVEVIWDTRSVSVGTYRFGLSATDIGLTVAGAVQSDRADAIVTAYSAATITLNPTPESAQPPILEFTSGDQTAFGGATVTIEFFGQTFEGDDFLVTIFYTAEDSETEVLIGTVTDPAATSVPFDTNGEKNDEQLPSGLYTIGGTISDGLNDTVEVPAAGRPVVQVVEAADATLTVSAPGSNIQVGQGDMVFVEWSTNVPVSEEGATVRVFAQSCTTDTLCNSTSVLTGGQIEILPEVALSNTSVDWDTTGALGRHVIWVEVDAPSLGGVPLTERAAGVVRVSVVASQVWVGSIGNGPGFRQGEVYQGVNFQDNAGTFLNTLSDYDNDGFDDFIISARYGKPFFQNPSGVGIGESYMVFGGNRRNETHNLNTVGTSIVPGVVFPAVRPGRDVQEETDGLGAVRQIPDQDGDNLPELMFGFPFIDSRGHTYPLVVRQEPDAFNSLEKARQFLGGGIVIVSSTNPKLSDPPTDLVPDPDAPLEQKEVVFLDLVGQHFRRSQSEITFRCAVGTPCGTCDMNECLPGTEQGPAFFLDLLDPNATPTCTAGQDGCFETFDGPWDGFNRTLSDGFPAVGTPFSIPFALIGATCACFNVANNVVTLPADTFLRSCALNLIAGGVVDTGTVENPQDSTSGSGFYPLRYCDFAGSVAENQPRAPFGARIIGRDPGTPGMESTTGDKFGARFSVSGGFLLVSAPNRVPGNFEVTGVPTVDVPNDPGIIYLFNINNLWVDWRDVVNNGRAPGADLDDVQCQGGKYIALDLDDGAPTAPQMPYQYQIDTINQCGRRVDLLERFPSPFLVMGEADQKIEVVEAVPDFNLDGREDFAIGAPLANNGDGAVYVAYRRDPAIEGDYLLSQLSRDPNDVERLAGLRINGRAGQGNRFGEVISKSLTVVGSDGSVFSDGVDFNGDGLDDLVLGNPNAAGGVGEIVIIFGTDDLISVSGGTSLSQLLTLRDPDSDNNGDGFDDPRAITITGTAVGDLFGFNVAVAGDFNGDGSNDLLVAAPGASPMFDSNDDGMLDAPGIDVINLNDPDSEFGDGVKDDVNGDNVINAADNLVSAGQVYVIFGATTNSNNLLDLVGLANAPIAIGTLGNTNFKGVVFVGGATDDQMGGGVEIKRQKRSFGVGPAGDVDGDGRDDILMGSILADPEGRVDAGEAYLLYGFTP